MKLESISLIRTEKTARLDNNLTKVKDYLTSLNMSIKTIIKQTFIALSFLAIIAAIALFLPILLLVFLPVILQSMFTTKVATLKRLIENQLFMLFYFWV